MAVYGVRGEIHVVTRSPVTTMSEAADGGD